MFCSKKNAVRFASHFLEVECKKKIGSQKKAALKGPLLYRGNQIRTDDILLPKQTLYQAELHPECVKYSKKGAEKAVKIVFLKSTGGLPAQP